MRFPLQIKILICTACVFSGALWSQMPEPETPPLLAAVQQADISKNSGLSLSPEPSSSPSPLPVTGTHKSVLIENWGGHNFSKIDGEAYTNATITRIEPDGIVVSDKDGIRKLRFKRLPPDVQEKYGYDPIKAEAYQQQIKAIAYARIKAEAEAAKELSKQHEKAMRDAEHVRSAICLVGSVAQSLSNSTVIYLANSRQKIIVEGLTGKADGSEITFYACRDGIYTINNSSVIQNGVPLIEKIEKWVFVSKGGL